MTFPKLLFSILFLIPLLSFQQVARAQPHYTQDIKTDIRLPEHVDPNVLKLFYNQKNIVAVTPSRVMQYAHPAWIERTKGENWVTATMDTQGNLWLASAKRVEQEKGKKFIPP